MAVRRHPHVKPGEVEGGGEKLADVRLIVHHEDLRHRLSRLAAAARIFSLRRAAWS